MEKTFYDLTNPQKSIWDTEEFYKGSPISNITGTTTILEKVNFEYLAKAINLFVQKNDSFRLKIVSINGTPKQCLEDYCNLEFNLVDVKDDKDFKKLERKISSTPFNILDSLLFKFILFRFPDGHGGFIVNMHHLISDAWTSGLVASEVMDFYTNLINKTEISNETMPSYLDWIEKEKNYLNSEKFIKDKAFWEDVFDELPNVATIPSKKIISNVSSTAKRKNFTIPKETIKLIREFCKNNNFSEYNFFMSVLSIYIYMISGLDNFVIGTPVLNRANFKEKQTAGMFISVIPFRVKINPDESFIQFTSQISSVFFKMFKHQKYPYQQLLQDLRSKFGTVPNLYKIAMSYQNMRDNASICQTPYEAKWSFNNNISDDIDVHFFDINNTGNIDIAYDYKTEKYTLDDIFVIHTRFLNILNQVLQNNNILIKDLELAVPDEINTILNKFNNQKMDFPSDKSLIELFEEQVLKQPENTALVLGDESLSYRELNKMSNAFAYYLLKKGIEKNDIVSIFMDFSIKTIISILGVLKAGCTYVLIDTSLPNERIDYILSNSKTKYLIVDKDNKEILFNNIINYQDINFKTNANLKSTYQDNFAIIYTSGSSGKPKGVLLHNLGFISLIYAFDNILHVSRFNKHLNISNISFDMFTLELFLSLVFGKTLYLTTDIEQKNPIYLSKYIEDNKIEFFMATPSKMELFLLNDKTSSCLKYLKAFLLGGEVFTKTLYHNLRKYTNAEIFNGYGPTEVSACSNIKHIVSEDDINIGSSIPNVNVYILNKYMKFCPVGVSGEIVVSGLGIANGYINNKELTDKAFNFGDSARTYKTGDIGYFNENGEIVFLGRNDSQLKINGLRVELSEIDSVVLEFPCIEKVATIYDDKKIITYYKSSKSIDSNKLKEHVKSKLPSYMVPQYFMEVNSFPLTTSGKLDVKRLPKVDNAVNKTKLVKPKNPTQEKIYNIFVHILNKNSLGILDNFFELGGDSLAAIKLSVEIFNVFNKTISVKEIFENPSIQELSLLLDGSEESEASIISKSSQASFYPISSAQKRIYYACKIAGEDSVLYNMPGGIIFDENLDVARLENALSTLFKRHESLRTYFMLENNAIVQKIDDEFVFHLEISKKIESYENIDLIINNFVRPFDLSKAPLLRTKLIKLDNSKYLLLIDAHHIILDGTSFQIFTAELCKLYNSKPLEVLDFSYKNFALLEAKKLKNGDFKEAENYWLDKLNR